MKLLFLFIGVVFATVLLTWAVEAQRNYRQENSRTVVVNEDASELQKSTNSSMQISQTEELLRSNPNIQNTILTDVSGGNSAGSAYITRSENGLRHAVFARLSEPIDGQVYEGWLVDKNDTGSFVSTGVLNKNTEGSYELVYEAGSSFDMFNDVVVTLETRVDATPEKHILEGSFEVTPL